MRRGRRLLALNLALLFVLALLPLHALAADITLDMPVSYTKTEESEHEHMTFTAPEDGFYRVKVTCDAYPDKYDLIDTGSGTSGVMKLYSSGEGKNLPISDEKPVYWLKSGQTEEFDLQKNAWYFATFPDRTDSGEWTWSMEKIEPDVAQVDHTNYSTNRIWSFTPEESDVYELSVNGYWGKLSLYSGADMTQIGYENGMDNISILMKLEAGTEYFVMSSNASVLTVHRVRHDGTVNQGEGAVLNWTLSDDGVLTLSGEGEVFVDAAPWAALRSEIREIVIGKDVRVNGRLLGQLPALEKITVEEGSLDHAVDNGGLYNADRTILFRAFGSENGVFVVPEGVDVIDYAAFSCGSQVSAVEFASAVESADSYAFVGSDNIGRIRFGGTPKEWRDFARTQSSLQSKTIEYYNLVFQDGLYFVPVESGYELVGCDRFVTNTITIPDMVNGQPVVSIGSDALFDSHYTMQNVVVPATVTQIATDAFDNNYNLENILVADGNPNYCDVDGVLFSKDCKTLFRMPRAKVSNGIYVIPDGTERIGENAFTRCYVLYVIAPEGVKRVDDRAFYDSGIERVGLPASLETIGNDAFQYSDVSRLYFAGTEAEWKALNSNNHAMFSVDTEFYFGETCPKEIQPEDRFDTMPNEDGNMFLIRCCYPYRSDGVIPDTINGKKVVAIDCSIFVDSVDPITITIPATIETVSDTAFNNIECRVKALIVDEANPYLSSKDGVLYNKDQTKLIAMPTDYDYEHRSFTVPDSVTEIGTGAFRFASQEELVIPAGVTKIAPDAFNFSTLKDIYFGGTQEEWDAFQVELNGCDNVTVHFNSQGEHVHEYTASVTAPTCTEQGYTTYTCACGDSYKDNYVDALGHDIETRGAKDATCTEAGYSGDKVCKRCGELIHQGSSKAPLGHDNEVRGAKDATCTEAGYTGDWVCKRCHETIEQGSVIEAKGHTWGDWTVTKAATEKEAGEQVRTCSVCGETEKQTIEKLKPSAPEFTDLKPNAFYTKAVAWAVENEVTSGKTKTTFAPNDKCTRGEVVTFLWRAAGKPEPKSTDTAFTDLKPKAYYYKAVLWAVENGVTSGTSDTTFEPNKTCTRGEVVTFMYRAAGKPALTSTDTTFTDLKPKAFYYKAVLWAVANGITSGKSSTTFAPNDTCTRGEIVTFLYRGKDQIKPAV